MADQGGLWFAVFAARMGLTCPVIMHDAAGAPPLTSSRLTSLSWKVGLVLHPQWLQLLLSQYLSQLKAISVFPTRKEYPIRSLLRSTFRTSVGGMRKTNVALVP